MRAFAPYYLSRLRVVLKRSLPPGVPREVQRIAGDDPAFAPRFQARALLRDGKQSVPLGNPKGGYAFRVKFRRAKSLMQRTLELRSEQTLDDLVHAANRSMHWDMDHRYSFYLNGEMRDEQYSFACPFENDGPPWTDEAVIGALGGTPFKRGQVAQRAMSSF